jgi:hypothetical protein
MGRKDLEGIFFRHGKEKLSKSDANASTMSYV